MLQLVLTSDNRPAQEIPLRHLTADQIWKQLLSVVGEHHGNIEAPSS